MNIEARILIAHGNADDSIPAEHIAAFRSARENTGADWPMIIYGGARHGFTNSDAEKYGLQSVTFDATADKRYWALMQSFFQEVFAD